MITVERVAPINKQELALHYGEDFVGWERTWLARLRQRRSGVSILFGPPGCGKTSYLRSLMARLLRTFEFYYVPVSAFDVLTNPSFVSFWVEQRGEGCGKHRIAIMEDAEELLLPRDEGSRAKVSNLLNIGDGFLGEHLNLHVVATTNAPIRQIDPAMLRPGRLMGSREFRRLTRPEAQRLAEAKGLTLADQPDYSLGELYCGEVARPALNVDRQIGFAQ
ncbi:MAG: ATP-binding protein [Verrucomicrobiales bacterium]|nr:ATP-binding protein [Verrucomicrobiales bacterium]